MAAACVGSVSGAGCACGFVPRSRLAVALDEDFLREFTERVRAAGIGRNLVVPDSLDAETLPETARSIRQALDRSPHPQGEWGHVRERLGDEHLAKLLEISQSSLRRYASGQRDTPDPVAWRLHVLTRLIASLSGSYNDYGVRRWFHRPRAQLGGQSPAEVFAAASTSGDDEPLEMLVELAEALTGPGLAA